MYESTIAIAYIDAPRLQRALHAGIQRLSNRREYINKINVFPVADGDTGTNMMFTLRSISASLSPSVGVAIDDYLQRIAGSALDGARGNSGAILAQYFQGFFEGCKGHKRLFAEDLGKALILAAKSAWQAMAEPVAGTLPSVLEAFASSVQAQLDAGSQDIRQLMNDGLTNSRVALANTPKQLAVLHEAGVVDAGAQGFVDLLEGIVEYIDTGQLQETKFHRTVDLPDFEVLINHDNPEHRYCTECMLQGESLDRQQLLMQLQQLDSSSVVIAGDHHKLRVHIHVDQPQEVFAICAELGEVGQQKADDMFSQAQALKRAGELVVMTDTGADIPDEMIDQLGIQRVSLRFNFAGQDYIDRISMNISQFYQLLNNSEQSPQTSQPPIGDYRRCYELLRGQDSSIINITVSASLSGTYQAALAAADDAQVTVYDSANGSAGQGLLVIAAAEMAEQKIPRQQILKRLDALKFQTKSFVTTRNLDYAARGGRVPKWLAPMARYLHVRPILGTSKTGLLKPKGVLWARANPVPGFARWLLRRLDKMDTYRLMITHGDDQASAIQLRELLLAGLNNVDQCWISETGSAIGVHAGPGVLVVGVQRWGNMADKDSCIKTKAGKQNG